MSVIEAQEDLEGGCVIKGRRKLKSGAAGVDFEVNDKQIKDA